MQGLHLFAKSLFKHSMLNFPVVFFQSQMHIFSPYKKPSPSLISSSKFRVCSRFQQLDCGMACSALFVFLHKGLRIIHIVEDDQCTALAVYHGLPVGVFDLEIWHYCWDEFVASVGFTMLADDEICGGLGRNILHKDGSLVAANVGGTVGDGVVASHPVHARLIVSGTVGGRIIYLL